MQHLELKSPSFGISGFMCFIVCYDCYLIYRVKQKGHPFMASMYYFLYPYICSRCTRKPDLLRANLTTAMVRCQILFRQIRTKSTESPLNIALGKNKHRGDGDGTRQCTAKVAGLIFSAG